MKKVFTVRLNIALLLTVLLVGVWMYYISTSKSDVDDPMIDSTMMDVAGKLPFTTWQTHNGVKVVFAKRDELPMVDISVVLDAGSIRDGDKLGLSNCVARMLEEGTQYQDAEAIANGFESVGAQVEAVSTRDNLVVSVRTLNQEPILTHVLELLGEVMHKPSFPEASVERVKGELLVAIEQQTENPGQIAQNVFFKSLYPEHPYGNPVIGTQASVRTLTRKDLMQFHQAHFVADNAVITIVGDVLEEQAKTISSQLANAFEKTAARKALPRVSMQVHYATRHIDFPSQQTHVFVGVPALAYRDPDAWSLQVGTFVLGGGFTSVLYNTIRDQKGLVYTIHSQCVPLKEKGPFYTMMQTKNGSVHEAMALMKASFKVFLEEALTDETIQLAKAHLSGAYALSLDSNAKTAAALSTWAYYDLPKEYFETYLANLNKVTRQSVVDAFKKHVDFNNLAQVTVGGRV